MVIGGSEIYRLALPFASRLYITHIDKIYDGDTWFPKFDLKDWSVVNLVINMNPAQIPITEI